MQGRQHVGARVRAVFVLVILLTGATGAFAQQAGTGSLTGTVTDNVGVVPGANVTVTEVATGVVRTTTTNEVGVFRFAGLSPSHTRSASRSMASPP